MVFASAPGYWLNATATLVVGAARDILQVDCPGCCLRQTCRSEVRLWGSTCSGGGGIGNAYSAIGHLSAAMEGLSISGGEGPETLPEEKEDGCAASPLPACCCCDCVSLTLRALLLLPRFRAQIAALQHCSIAASQRSRRLVLDPRAPRHCHGRRQRTMSAILSADDLNDFISPGVACIKPIETLPAANPEDGAVRLSLACACRRPVLTNARMRTKSPPKTKSPPRNRRRPPRCR
jgi:hypothetical protein